MFVIQHLYGPNDSNGNPRRVFAVYELARGESTPIRRQYFDEGYQGSHAVPASIRERKDTVWLPAVDISASMYRILVREGEEAGN